MTTAVPTPEEQRAEHERAERERIADESHAEAEAYFERLDGIAGGLGDWSQRRTSLTALDIEPRVVGDVARIMRDGPVPVDMLIERWLVKGVLHWVYSDAEAGKTWLALKWAALLMQAGLRVVWNDEELGEDEIAKRLIALGVAPEVVETKFVYFAFPSWHFTSKDIETWRQLLIVSRPALVVFDTATDALTEANLDEDKGQAVTAWVKAYPEAATALGITTVVLDHTTKGGLSGNTKHAVGSRAKRAKAKVQYGLESKKGYDRDTLGKVEVTLTKNTLGATIPKERTFNVGGDGNGNFIWTVAGMFDHDPRVPKDTTKLHRAAVAFLRAHPDKQFTKTQIADQINGNRAAKMRAVEDVGASEIWPVKAVPVGSKTMYEYDPSDDAATPDAETHADATRNLTSVPDAETKTTGPRIEKDGRRWLGKGDGHTLEFKTKREATAWLTEAFEKRSTSKA